VTSSVLPELITEGDTVEEAIANTREACEIVLESYEDQGEFLPIAFVPEFPAGTFHTERLAFA